MQWFKPKRYGFETSLDNIFTCSYRISFPGRYDFVDIADLWRLAVTLLNNRGWKRLLSRCRRFSENIWSQEHVLKYTQWSQVTAASENRDGVLIRILEPGSAVKMTNDVFHRTLYHYSGSIWMHSSCTFFWPFGYISERPSGYLQPLYVGLTINSWGRDQWWRICRMEIIWAGWCSALHIVLFSAAMHC